jgi:hypothetical protein
VSTKHYVEFLYPGLMFPEIEVREVETRDVNALSIPEGCFALTFFDRTVVEQDGERLRGTARNKSKRYYVGGQVYDLDALAAEKGRDSIIYANVAGNGYTRAIHCSTGNWQPLEDGDVVLAAGRPPRQIRAAHS